MLLDTSGLLCVYDRDEARHDAARLFFAAAGSKLIHNYVLAEFVALASARGLARQTTLAFIVEVQAHPDIDIVWIDRELHLSALNYLRARLDKTYSLCDAVSFVLMRQRGITEALTTDRHFEQAGFRRLLPGA